MNAVDTNILVYYLDGRAAGATTLSTEDMGAPTVIGGIQLVNPFV